MGGDDSFCDALLGTGRFPDSPRYKKKIIKGVFWYVSKIMYGILFLCESKYNSIIL